MSGEALSGKTISDETSKDPWKILLSPEKNGFDTKKELEKIPKGLNIMVTTKIPSSVAREPYGTEIAAVDELGVNENVRGMLEDFDESVMAVNPFGKEGVFVEGDNEQEFAGDRIFEYFTEEEIKETKEELERSDGLVLPGGLETRPYELLTARLAYDMGVPILAICAGQNAIVRTLGGKTKKLPDDLVKKHNNAFSHKVHTMNAVPGTFYEKIVGPDPVWVNSIHSYVVEDPGPLEILARDDDNNIEVVGDEGHRVIASRFHPETTMAQVSGGKNLDDRPSIGEVCKFMEWCDQRRHERYEGAKDKK